MVAGAVPVQWCVPALASHPRLRLLSHRRRRCSHRRPVRTETAIDIGELQALILRCAQGDLPAFRNLYAAQAARLHGLALRITREPGLAADAVQDTFLQVWRRAEQFDRERGSAEAWLAGLVRYRAIDIVRRRSRERVGMVVDDQPSTDPDALAELTATAEGAALRSCMDQLPPDRRALLVQAFVDGLTHSELAQKSGQPLGTVKARIRRALMSLKQCLEP